MICFKCNKMPSVHPWRYRTGFLPLNGALGDYLVDPRRAYRSSGVNPVFLATRASILGPISAWS